MTPPPDPGTGGPPRAGDAAAADAGAGATVGDLGEIELVARIVRRLRRAAPEGVVVGPGDDAAVLAPREGATVVTVDQQVEDVHFRRDWIEPGLLGRRALAVNVSDLAAMGASPAWAVCALALPADTLLRWVEALVDGLATAGVELGCPVVGGDVCRSLRGAAITVTILGSVAPGRDPLRRDGARPGDGLWITGNPGRAAAGRALLEAGYSRGGEGELRYRGEATRAGPVPADVAACCLSAYLVPRPPLGLAVAVAEHGLATAAMDVSDGVAVDLGRMCDASGTGVRVDGTVLTDDPALRACEEAGLGRILDLALAGGEDYELMCAVPEGAEPEMRRLGREHDVPVRRAGRFVAPEAGRRLLADGEERDLRGGWEHFRADDA